jgi:hypothetical protein
MTDTHSAKKRDSKTTKKTTKQKKSAGRQPSKTKSDHVKIPALHTLDKAREQLRKLGDGLTEITEKKEVHDLLVATRSQLGKLGDRLHEATEKGMHAVKEIAEEVHRFSHDATELTKKKIEIHNLKNEKNNLLALMGQKLRNLHKAKKLSNIQPKFSYDFNKLDELDTLIAEKEREADNLSRDIYEI